MKHRDIIVALDGNKAVAAICRDDPVHVVDWKRRNSIPRKHWPAVVSAARQKSERLLLITVEAMARHR